MKWFLFFTFIIFSILSFAQKPGIYWIQFTDKNNSPYSISSPSQFLSQRALDRRVRQNIPVVTQDVPVNPSYVDSINHIFPVFNSLKWQNGVLVNVTDSTLLAELSGISFVDTYKYVRPLFIKSNPGSKEQLGTLSDVYNYAWGADQITMLHGNELHNLGFKGDSMLIAILDAGFTGANNINIFDSIFQNNRLISTRNFVIGNNNTTVFQGSSHGTSVLSTMGSLKIDTMVGTAPHASFSLNVSEDNAGEYIFEEYTWACAAEYADSLGADIISSSLGYTTFDDPTMNHTYAEMDGHTSVASRAATIATRKGMIVVVSAGNSGSQPWHHIGIPADADSILTVGAVDVQKQPATFTSVGPSADGRIKPDVAAMGVGTSVVNSSGNMFQGNGTSFACPIIAGMTACLWQAHKNTGNMEIIQAIRKSSDRFTNPDTLTGYGIPNFAYANNILSGNVDSEDYSNKQFINVFPNPFTDQLSIQFYNVNLNDISFELSDIVGRILYKNTGTLSPHSLNTIEFNNLQDVSNGIYILKISTSLNEYKRLVVKK